MADPFLVKDIRPNNLGSGSSNPANLTAVGNTLFFIADGGPGKGGLWKSDGTAAGTVPVKEVGFRDDFTAIGNTLYFTAEEGVANAPGVELWKSDGTAAGTVQVKDIFPGVGDSSPYSLTAIGNTLYFSARENGINNRELWKSDGTATGTVLVKEINPGFTNYIPNGSYPSGLTAIGNTLYFTATDGSVGYELWKSDGTAAGTVLVKDILPGVDGSIPSKFIAVGNTLFFIAFGGPGQRGLWKSDGTAAGTALVKEVGIGGDFTVIGNTLYFTAKEGVGGEELWKSDGTAGGTVLVKDIFPGISSSFPRNLTAVGNTLYFTAGDGSSAPNELWKSDGTAAGTVLVKDIFPGVNTSFPRDLTAVGNTLYFTARDGNVGYELWKSDGTAAGTVRAADILPGTGSSSPKDFTAIGTTLYFSAFNLDVGRELWGIPITLSDSNSSGGDTPKVTASSLFNKGQNYDLALKDYDGNPHGYSNAIPEGVATSYKFQGEADVNRDGLAEGIFTNRESGRWATIGVDPITGAIDYSRHGQGGNTRVVGIYIDPLVAEGEANSGFLLSGEVAPKRFGPFDSQRRFQNDLRIDNLLLKTSGDYDKDGFQEVYWRVNDGTAYLRSIMHADGNIQYANYQNEEQMRTYLTATGNADVIQSIL